MTSFTVCQNRFSNRLALIPEDEIDLKEWNQNGQQIEDETWLDARQQVDMTDIYEFNGEYFYVDQTD